MIYEVIYTKEKSNKFEDYVKNVFAINFKNDCFVFFHLGKRASMILDIESPDYLEAYRYIQNLEKSFNVNINWIDLSYIFDNISDKLDQADIKQILYYVKQAHKNSIEDYIKNNFK